MKVNVNEVSGPVLDCLVAKCLGVSYVHGQTEYATDGRIYQRGTAQKTGPHFSSDPAKAWPIIEREKIWLKFPFMVEGDVEAIHGHFGFPNIINAFAPNGLTAAMRCFLKSKVGNTVEIPDDVFEDLCASSVS